MNKEDIRTALIRGLLLGAVLGFVFVLAGAPASLLAADRTCADVPAAIEGSIRPTDMALKILPDAGCAVLVRVALKRTDGGPLVEETPFVEIAGQNRTICINLMDAGVALFKAQNGPF